MIHKTLRSNGCRLSYYVEGQGPSVVLIHGTSVGGSAWRPQLDALVPHFRCLWFDNRGYGQSLPIPAALSVEDMGADVLALMDAESMDRAHLIGHSLGGAIAVSAASQAPSRVLSLSLLNTFVSGKTPLRLDPLLLLKNLRSMIGTLSMRRRALLELMMPASYLAQHNVDKLAQHVSALFGREIGTLPRVAMKQIAAMSRFDSAALLPKLKGIPTLVMSARYDLLTPPSEGKRLAEGLNGRYVELSDAAHAAPIQCPEEVNALLLSHLRG